MSLSAAHLILTISNSDDTNPFDRVCHKAAAKATKAIFPIPTCLHKREFWVPVIKKLVLSLSDQQLLTGLAILIAALWTHCTITVYHFALANDLACFSTTVHLITLRVLRDYLFENHVQRDWRVALMVVMALLLAASTVMQGHYLWNDGWPYHAQCLFDELVGNVHGSPRKWMIVNLIFICVNYSLTIVPLFHRPTEFVKYWLETKSRAAMAKAIEHLIDIRRTPPQSLIGSIKRLTCKLLILVIRVVIWTHFALSTFIGSRIFMFVQDAFWFFYNLRRIMADRKIPSSNMVGDENAMTFGQIMPILLFSSIVLVFRDAYYGT